MKSVLGFIRKADTDFGLIQSGDRVPSRRCFRRKGQSAPALCAVHLPEI